MILFVYDHTDISIYGKSTVVDYATSLDVRSVVVAIGKVRPSTAAKF
jgi:hypothetical protein